MHRIHLLNEIDIPFSSEMTRCRDDLIKKAISYKSKKIKIQHFIENNRLVDRGDDQEIYDSVDIYIEYDMHKKLCSPGFMYFSCCLPQEQNICPGIAYLGGGYINVHFDPIPVLTPDANIITYLHCFDSNDIDGGTMVYFGENMHDRYIIKESVTPGHGFIFPGYIPHSGIPVADGKYKFIVQSFFVEIRDIPKFEDLLKIELSDGYYIVRKNNYDKIMQGFHDIYMSCKDFYPYYLAIRGCPTYGNININQSYYIHGGSQKIYPIVKDGYFVTLDEAIYNSHLTNMDVKCNIYDENFNSLYMNIDLDTYYIVLPQLFAIYFSDKYRTQTSQELKNQNILNSPFLENGEYFDSFNKSVPMINVAFFLEEA
jgi:hypothetical protein